MKVDFIKNGFVIDHIRAGKGMRLYRLLGLESSESAIAMMQNVPSQKMGKKDIIKIDTLVEPDLDVIGFAEPGATVNIIRDGQLVLKKPLVLPTKLTNVIKCKNPRCICQTEQELDHVFCLSDRETGTYRCMYCETKGEL